MDPDTIDQNFQQLQKESEDTIDALKALAQKLQTAVDAGDQNAKEWILDLKQIALSVQEEENQATVLLQSIHEFVLKEMQAAQPAPPPPPQPQPVQYQQPPVQYQEPPQYPPGGMGMGGMMGGLGMGGGMGGGMGRFMNSGFGRAMVSGAGFGIGADIIGHIFH
ncbi:MAG TPA: hypothetical protein VFW71_09945 [Actinomycetota bacterium]|nr:hypothetical protein [Actinomycetota bacterium]